MEHGIGRIGVIGAGVMGAAIAAHVANAGVAVLLLDLPARDGGSRNALAEGAIARMLKTDPAPFMEPGAARRIATGNTEDDLSRLGECDWIIEAVAEKLDVKQALYRRLEAVRKPGGAISSNTSTIPLSHLVEGMPEEFARAFLITHFFNPPRYMRLLELVTGPATDPAIAARVSRFCDVALGKTVVACHDTPGFIANRIGAYWLQLGLTRAIDLGLSVEQADAVMGKPLGIPKTGVFGLLDLVGIDLMPHINANLAGALPQSDAFHAANRDLPLIRTMIAEGRTGRKGRGGFYRLDRASGRGKEVLDLGTGAYRPAEAAAPPEVAAAGRDLRALLSAPGPIGDYAWGVLGRTLAYAASLVPEATDDVAAVDTAMRLGYNWKRGPFELIDRLDAAWFIGRLQHDGIAVPKLLRDARPFYRTQDGRRQSLHGDGAYHDIARPDGVLLLEDIRAGGKPLLKNRSAAVWDIGDGVACFEATTKMGTFDPGVFELIQQAIPLVAEKFRALIIYNEGGNFSAGANLGLALFAANIAAWNEIEKLVKAGQAAFKALKYSPFPVVAAPFGLALGGGCEIVLNSDAVQAHAETYIGLVECGVGLVPGWGGCGEMLDRWRVALPHGPMPATSRVFEQVSTATVSKSAADAKALRFLRPGDGITMNRDRLLADAKARALALAEDYSPPKPPEFTLPGPSGQAALAMAAEGFRKRGLATAHDMTVARGLGEVLSGGDADLLDPVSESRMLDLECSVFMRLIRDTATLARIEHVLETGKPLRN